MELKNELFEHIKEEMSGYRLHPSEKAWTKLESRLHGIRSPFWRISWIRRTVAAAIFLLAVGLFLWNYNTAPFDSNSSMEPHPTSMEELPFSDDCHPYCLILRVRNQLPEYYAHPSVKTS